MTSGGHPMPSPPKCLDLRIKPFDKCRFTLDSGSDPLESTDPSIQETCIFLTEINASSPRPNLVLLKAALMVPLGAAINETFKHLKCSVKGRVHEHLSRPPCVNLLNAMGVRGQVYRKGCRGKAATGTVTRGMAPTGLQSDH